MFLSLFCVVVAVVVTLTAIAWILTPWPICVVSACVVTWPSMTAPVLTSTPLVALVKLTCVCSSTTAKNASGSPLLKGKIFHWASGGWGGGDGHCLPIIADQHWGMIVRKQNFSVLLNKPVFPQASFFCVWQAANKPAMYILILPVSHFSISHVHTDVSCVIFQYLPCTPYCWTGTTVGWGSGTNRRGRFVCFLFSSL